MRPTLVSAVLSLLLLLPSAANAQESYGYGFLGGTFGGHGLDGAFRYGIGGEAGVAHYFTLGGEVGGIAKNGSGILVSGNGSFHIPADSRIDPFVTGGISIGRIYQATGLWVNLGGGLNYWFYRHAGARVELRGYPGGYHLNSFAEIRLGVVFR